MSNVRAARDTVVEASRRYTRLAHEAEDLAHDIILGSLRRGAAVDTEVFERSAHGAARRHGAFLARCAGRRRARETRYAAETVARAGVEVAREAGASNPVVALPSALRTTLLLLLMELEKAELRVALGVSDAALRKRFQALRARSPLKRPDLPIPPRTPVLTRLRSSQVELLPRLTSARASDDPAGRAVAVSDPDGHGMIFAQVLTPGAGAATTRKEKPC